MMNIAAMSMLVAQGNVRVEANMSIMKQALNVAEEQGVMLTKMLEATTNIEQLAEPHLGTKIDLKL